VARPFRNFTGFLPVIMPDHHRFVRKFVNAKLLIMSSRLTLISHAATSAVRAAAFPLDESIDEAGRRDAQALASSLSPFTATWTSPSKRAIETAAALGLEAKIDASLRDIDLGRWAGRTFGEVEEKEPKEIERWLSDPASVPHGGESVAQLIGRVSEWLIGVKRFRGRTAVVSHPAVIRAAIVAAIEANPTSFWRIDIAPLGIVELRSNGERWALRSIK
jgi:broad specificity phosphatase PhoE